MAYLHDDAAKLPIETMIARVDAAQARAAAAAYALAPGEFESARGVLQRLVETNVRVAQQVLYVALSGELPPDEPVIVADDRDALLAASDAAIESLWIHVRDADPDAFLETTWRHHEYGELTWRGWLLSLEVSADKHAHELEEMHHA